MEMDISMRTVRDIPRRVMWRLEKAATEKGRTTSAEARTVISEAVGHSRPLREGEESAADFLMRISAPLRELGFEIPPERSGMSRQRGAGGCG